MFRLALVLARDTHQITRKFPRSEIFGLCANVRRAATSVALNIAEGAGRRTRRDFAHFIDIARGSLFETLAAMHVAEQLQYISSDELTAFRHRADILSRKLSRFRTALRP